MDINLQVSREEINSGVAKAIAIEGTAEEINETLASVSEKQDKLVSGTNIKTINGTSILGEGNVDSANKDLSNLSAEGKSYTSSLGMPSDNYIDIETGASGSIWVAPANGYVFLRMTKIAGTAGAAIKLISSKNSVENPEYGPKLGTAWTAVTSANASYIYLPVLKNDKVKYVYTVPAVALRFIYAEGEI